MITHSRSKQLFFDSDGEALAPMVEKLQLWRELDPDDQRAVLSLPYKLMTLDAGRHIVRQGDKATQSCLLLSGFAVRHKVAGNGGRSISAIHMKGDIVDLQNSLLGSADHSVQTLSKATIALISREAIVELAFRRPDVGMAMWYDTLVDGSVFREWILNIARREAKARIAHVLCEFGVRLEALGMGSRCSYEFPMTQEQLGDATGLTSVHVSRSLRSLEEEGLIARTMRYVAVDDWGRLQALADFDPAYLHLKASEQPVALNGD